MRAERLLDLVALLRSHERISATSLAAQLGVSKRTVLRDLDALSLSGVPIYAEPGRNGGFSMLPGYRPETAGLTPEETAVLVLPGGEAAATALGRKSEFRSARRKLEAVLSDGAAREVGDVTSWLLVVPEGWGQPVDPPAAVPLLASASARHEVVDIDYRSIGGARARRRVRPIGLVLAGRAWYLLADREDTGEQRTYRLDRMHDVALTGSEFTPRIPLPEAWAAARASFREGSVVTYTLRTSEADLPVVTYVVSLVSRIIDVIDCGEGVREIRASSRALEAPATILTGLADRIQIQTPPELIEAVVAASRRNLTAYAE